MQNNILPSRTHQNAAENTGHEAAPAADTISTKANYMKNNILHSRNQHNAVPAVDKTSTAAASVENRRNPSRAARKSPNNIILITAMLGLVGQNQAYFIPTNTVMNLMRAQQAAQSFYNPISSIANSIIHPNTA